MDLTFVMLYERLGYIYMLIELVGGWVCGSLAALAVIKGFRI
jgi:Co/Zn/Cd efflux system component